MLWLAISAALLVTPQVTRRSTPSATPHAPVVPYDFQGTVLGTPLADWRASNPEATCAIEDLPEHTVCEVAKPAFIQSYGSLRYIFYAPKGVTGAVLYRIDINAAGINERTLYDGVTGKWGKPKTYSTQIDTWERGGSTIRFMRLYPGVAVTFTLDAVEAEMDAAKKAKAAANF